MQTCSCSHRVSPISTTPAVTSSRRRISLGFKFFHDQADAVGSTSSKQSQVGTIGLSGDSRDSFGGGGASFYSLGGSYGNLDIRATVVFAADAATTRSNGGFGRSNAAIGRVQALSGPLSLYVALRDQIATKNLDSFALERNHANLTGGGAGISWARNNDFLVKASYAHRIGSDRVTSEPDHAGQFWVQLVKSF